MTIKRRAFTLLEMLITITVLVMLLAVFMFATLEATASADAANIISNMNHIKAAILMWYKQNSSRLVPDSSAGYKIRTDGTDQLVSEFVRDHSSEFLKYLDNTRSLTLRSTKDNNTGDYSIMTANNAKKWYVCYNLGRTRTYSDMEASNIKIKSRLAGKAKSLGLFGKTDFDEEETTTVYTNQKFACMLVLDLGK